MALPWQIPLECAPPFKKSTKTFEPSLLKHYMNIKLQDVPRHTIQTGLMCEININNVKPSTIMKFIKAGMTTAKIKFSQGKDSGFQNLASIREAVHQYSRQLKCVYPLAIVMDIDGPELVTGYLKQQRLVNPVEVRDGNIIKLTTDITWKNFGDIECLYFGCQHLSDFHQGDIVILDNNLTTIKLKVEEVGLNSIECRVLVGGPISSKMPVRIIPGRNEPLPRKMTVSPTKNSESSSCTDINVENDLKTLHSQVSWAISADVDAIIVYQMETTSDVMRVKNCLGEKGKHLLIIVSIDTESAIRNLDDILSLADGIFLDRSSLSGNIGVSEIFLAQKFIMARCKDIGKPCICKTVINEELPAVCVTDIANIVMDGASVLFVQFQSEEQLKVIVPKYDVIKMAQQCLAAVSIISRYAENIMWKPSIYGTTDFMKKSFKDSALALCTCAVEIAVNTKAIAIMCLTNSGRAAKILSFIKPPCHIIAVTKECHVARKLRLWRGIIIFHYFESTDNCNHQIESQIYSALDYCKGKRILQAGDPYVVMLSSQREGNIDSIRLLYASAKNTISAM